MVLLGGLVKSRAFDFAEETGYLRHVLGRLYLVLVPFCIPFSLFQ